MKTRMKKIALALTLSMTMLLGGCQFAGRNVVFTTGLGSKDVFRIGDMTCSLSEAKVYLCNYQNIYGTAYGINLWSQDASKKELQTYVKDMTISEIARVDSMALLAKEQEVSLTDDEENNIVVAAKAYYESLSKAEIAYMDVTEDDIKTMYENYTLADMLYNSLTNDVNEEVSDDEARIMHAMQIYVSNKDVADTVAQRLAAGEDFASLASEYNEASEIEVTFGRNDVPEAVEEIAFSLDDDQISECIAAEEGYYFIKCTNKYDEEMTQENKTVIAQEREKNAFNDTYDAFVSEVDSMMNYDLWDTVDVDTSGDITTNSFFSTYTQYIAK